MQSSKTHEIDVQNMRQLAINAIEFCLDSLVPLPVLLNSIYDFTTKSSLAHNDESTDNRDDRRVPVQYSLQEKAFCTQLVYGYFRHAGLLRLALHDFVKRPQDLPRDCLIAFYLGAYEILFLQNKDKQKDATYATLFEYVEIVKEWYGQNLAGLTNAILRNIQRNKEKLLANMESAQKSYLEPISSNQIPSKKSIRNMHELADLSPIFTHEINHSFLQSIVEDSFFAPVPTYRINTKFKHAVLEKLEQLEESSSSENMQASTQENTEKYFKKETYAIAETDYSCFEDLCLYSPKQKASEKEIQSKEHLRYLKEWEKEGILTRQGVGSQLLVKKITTFLKKNVFTDENPDNTTKGNPLVWDACCGRGGKSSAFIEMGIPVHLCSDPNIERLTFAKENLNRLNLLDDSEENNPIFHVSVVEQIATFIQENSADLDTQNVLIAEKTEENTKENASPIQALSQSERLTSIAIEKFSCILLDSPCSTSGTLARNPEVKHRITKQTLEASVNLQSQLLETTWQCLKEKGYLIYITCSLFSQENEEQVRNFLANHDAVLVEQDYIIPHKINPEFKGHDTLFYAILQK